jgi:plastocyanin
MLLRLAGMLGVWLVVGAAASGAGAENQAVMALQGPNRFAPNDVTINQHETVTWTNGGGTHNVQFNDGSYEQPTDPSSSSWTVSRTFDTAGTFTYICRQHGTAMSGTVHVLQVDPPPENPPPGGGPPAEEPGGGGSTNPPGSGGPAPGGQSPGGEAGELKITLKASDSTPLAGKRVRLFGTVKPALDGRKLQIQKRLRSGKYKTIATVRLHAAAGDKSTYSLKLRLAKDVVLRARVPSEDDVSRTRKLDVHGTA